METIVQANGSYAIVGPGDVAFTPPRWMHFCIVLETNTYTVGVAHYELETLPNIVAMSTAQAKIIAAEVLFRRFFQLSAQL
jgi:ribosomal protein L16 Arg81 hydroxylase